jgi:hypothetical protein
MNDLWSFDPENYENGWTWVSGSGPDVGPANSTILFITGSLLLFMLL